MSQTLDQFLRDFVLPLVRGEVAHVRAPLELTRVRKWCGEIDGASAELLGRIDEVRRDAVAELVLSPPEMLFDEADLALAAGLYNLLSLAHPAFFGFARQGSLARVRDTALACLAIAPAATKTSLLARHALVRNFLRLERDDVVVRWWTGRAAFRGQAPDRRLLRWPKLRRVTQSSERVRVLEVLEGEVSRAGGVLERVLRASPLTDLVGAGRQYPQFVWSAATAALTRDTELTRAVVHDWLKNGLTVATVAGAPARALLSFERWLKTSRPRAADVRTVIALFTHIDVLLAWAEEPAGAPDPSSPLVRQLLQLEASGEKNGQGATWLLALPEVAGRIHPLFATPPGVREDARLAARWSAQRGQVRQFLGEERLAAMHTVLSRALEAR